MPAKKGMTLAQVSRLPATCNVETAALALGVSRASAYMAIDRGEFPVQVIRVNRRMRVLTSSLLAVLDPDRGQVARSA